MKPILVYIAGSFLDQERLRKEAEWMQAEGRFVVVSNWLWELPFVKGVENVPQDLYRRAKIDMAQVKLAHMLVIDTEVADMNGGREVEFGMALLRRQPSLLVRVGPERNIFHSMAHFGYRDWERFKEDVVGVTYTPTALDIRMRLSSMSEMYAVGSG